MVRAFCFLSLLTVPLSSLRFINLIILRITVVEVFLASYLTDRIVPLGAISCLLLHHPALSKTDVA